MTEPTPDQNPPKDLSDTSARFLIPRAGGRIVARSTTLMMLLIVTTPSVVYLPAAAFVMFFAVVVTSWRGSMGLPLGVGRLASQTREHLARVTFDWLTIAGILIIAIFWNFLRPHPSWLFALPIALTAFSFWTAQFAALPAGAMGRWFQFQLKLLTDSFAAPFRKKAEADKPMPKDAPRPAPAPVSPVEHSSWHSDQQDRFDDWLAEEINRFGKQENSKSKKPPEATE